LFEDASADKEACVASFGEMLRYDKEFVA